ncbi:hypothetical protein TWF694_002535 [Orbilia ellipsospora]|uniref:Uncharacterized protein n=1 Tax=Orbilia ellipsospora TaxID=2528407 RepID=A0AAV9X3H4_9PEZI
MSAPEGIFYTESFVVYRPHREATDKDDIVVWASGREPLDTSHFPPDLSQFQTLPPLPPPLPPPPAPRLQPRVLPPPPTPPAPQAVQVPKEIVSVCGCIWQKFPLTDGSTVPLRVRSCHRGDCPWTYPPHWRYSPVVHPSFRERYFG